MYQRGEILDTCFYDWFQIWLADLFKFAFYLITNPKRIWPENKMIFHDIFAKIALPCFSWIARFFKIKLCT